MKGFITFFYACLVVFTVLGGSGYLFYHNLPQFATPLVFIGVILSLAFFGKIKLPTKDGLQ